MAERTKAESNLGFVEFYRLVANSLKRLPLRQEAMVYSTSMEFSKLLSAGRVDVLHPKSTNFLIATIPALKSMNVYYSKRGFRVFYINVYPTNTIVNVGNFNLAFPVPDAIANLVLAGVEPDDIAPGGVSDVVKTTMEIARRALEHNTIEGIVGELRGCGNDEWRMAGVYVSQKTQAGMLLSGFLLVNFALRRRVGLSYGVVSVPLPNLPPFEPVAEIEIESGRVVEYPLARFVKQSRVYEALSEVAKRLPSVADVYTRAYVATLVAMRAVADVFK